MFDAQTLTKLLNGHWYRDYGSAPCPVCQPEKRRDQSSLTLKDDGDRLLLYCHKSGCTFSDVMDAVGGSYDHSPYSPPTPVRAEMPSRSALRAMDIWENARPARGSGVETYLQSRTICADLPDTVRFSPDCRHSNGQRYPAMIARVGGADGFGIHRTYLSRDFTGKAACDPARAMLGRMTGGGVHLAHGDGPLVVGEGIETVFSYVQLVDLMLNAQSFPYQLDLTNLPLAHEPKMIAALSTSGLRNLTLPPRPGTLIIASDGDCAGHSAALHLAHKADRLGWQVYHNPAPHGRDWNDVLRAMLTPCPDGAPS